VGAGLFVRSLRHAVTLDMGMDASRIVVADVDLGEVGYSRQEADALYRRMLERVGALPGVERAAITVSTPFRSMLMQPVRIPGRDSLPRPTTGGGPYLTGVTDGYFATTGVEVRRGRGITAADVGAAAPVAVVNEALARLYWPGADPLALGACMIVGRDSTGPCRTVVGVVENAKMSELREDPVPQIYLPLPPGDTVIPSLRALLVRTRSSAPGAAAALVPAVRGAMIATAPALPYANVRPFTELYAGQVRPWRLGATMFSVFGGAALLLAVVGLYAVLAYAVSQRTRELGVRIALGAQHGDVVRLVVGQGMRVATVGLLAGAVGAAMGGRLLRDQLFGVSWSDPWVFAAVATVLLLVAAAASWIPARRASRVDPATALRAE
jgi:predicted permease